MSPLPRFVVLKSVHNDRYLSKVTKEVSTQTKLPETFLKFSGQDVTSPFARFEVEIAKKNPEYVHIRCCANNKYLVTVQIESGDTWILAAADKPVEDVDHTVSSTMFQPSQAVDYKNEDQYFRFLHVQSRHYPCLWLASEPYNDGLSAGSASKDRDHCDVFKVLNWESLVIFPKTVAFKLSGDNRYFAKSWIQGQGGPYLQLVSTDIGDETIENEISTFGDGYVRIRSVSAKRLWKRHPYSDNWILADSSDTTDGDSDTLFWPIKLADNVVALRNLGNNRFCKILTKGGITNCLNPSASYITHDVKLEVVECVMSRSIYNINFCPPEEGRIYNIKEIQVACSHADNHTNSESTIALTFSYKETRSSTIGGSVSLKTNVTKSLQVAAFPLIVEGKIEISAEVPATIQWGKTDIVGTSTETSYMATVPPMTRTIVTLKAKQGTCEIPFSYTQLDTLHNGNTSIQNMDDGIYTGINMFSFEFITRQEKLPEIMK